VGLHLGGHAVINLRSDTAGRRPSLQSDCQNTDFWCFGVGGLTGSAVDNGYCSAGTPCANGQSDCKSTNAKVLCTNTKYGPFCIGTTFALGNIAAIP
jgi:hypothetical protein